MTRAPATGATSHAVVPAHGIVGAIASPPIRAGSAGAPLASSDQRAAVNAARVI